MAGQGIVLDTISSPKVSPAAWECGGGDRPSAPRTRSHHTRAGTTVSLCKRIVRIQTPPHARGDNAHVTCAGNPALTMKDLIAAKARERESLGGQGVEILPHLQGKTRDELGALAGEPARGNNVV
jgi:hypothetical protein